MLKTLIANNILSGFYAPLTKEGNIVVDGVLTSCYGSFDATLAHTVMTLMQWFPEIIDGIFGEDTGNSVYVKIKQSFGKLLLPYGYFY